MLWAVQAVPSSQDAPKIAFDGAGQRMNVLALDDETGDWYCGGKNMSKTWAPSGGSGLQLISPTPTADPRIFDLPKAPAILLLFRGNGSLQQQGIDNDFVLNGAEIALNYTPGLGETFQAVVG